LRGGFIHGVVTGVFPARPEPWEVRFYSDVDYTTVLNKLGEQARLHSGVARPRLGTVLVDLVVRDATVAEYPHGAFGFLATISGVTRTTRRSIPPSMDDHLEPGQPEHRRAMDRPGGAQPC
jgi:hypothetical protein